MAAVLHNFLLDRRRRLILELLALLGVGLYEASEVLGDDGVLELYGVVLWGVAPSIG